MRLYLDLETYSETPISAGTHVYARSAEILLFAYAFDDAPARVIEYPTDEEMDEIISEAKEIVIHNSAFDRAVLRWHGVDVPLAKTHDTMAQALLHGLPGSLGELCKLLKVPVDTAKDAEGRKHVLLFCKPRPATSKVRRATAMSHPEEWARFVDYARLDVEACREVAKRLPKWNDIPRERLVWMLDQRINERGVLIDMDLVEGAQRAVETEQALLTYDAQRQTAGIVASATQRDAMLAYLETVHEVLLPDLKASTVERALAEDMPQEVRELLATRLSATTTSVAKYRSLARSTCPDNRLRGTLQYCGAARTGRWAGRLFQPQNLPRPSMPQADIDAAIEVFTLGLDVELIHDVMAAASAALRGCIVAPPGRKLVVADLSNIEGRVLAWLAVERWKLDAFAAYDRGDGPDLYKLAYARAFGKQPGDVTKDERQIGKVMELACGYQGGVGAFNAMGAMYGLTFEEARAKELVGAWRKAHSSTAALWRNVEEAAIMAVKDPGKVYIANHLWFQRTGAWLKMLLPSGRHLCYPSPKMQNGRLTYMGVDQHTRQWSRIKTYGGKLVENATQAVARDVLADAMLRAEALGFDIVLSVHDELITEAGPKQRLDDLVRCMATSPTWAEGLPLAAAGFAAERYRKD